MTDEDLKALLYQHVVQLTVAGESLKRAHQLAYAAAAVVFDDESHRRNLSTARQAQGRGNISKALPMPDEATDTVERGDIE